MKKRVLVTGANGYIGEGVVKVLLDKGIEVTATDFDIKKIDARAEKVSADLFAIEDPYVFLEDRTWYYT